MPFEAVTLGFKFSVRLHQLTARDVVVVTCPSCHKVYYVPPYVLLERYHEHCRIEALAPGFHCKRCGNRQNMSWRIDRDRSGVRLKKKVAASTKFSRLLVLRDQQKFHFHTSSPKRPFVQAAASSTLGSQRSSETFCRAYDVELQTLQASKTSIDHWRKKKQIIPRRDTMGSAQRLRSTSADPSCLFVTL